MNTTNVRSVIIDCLGSKLANAGLQGEALTDDFDLLEQGVIDSFGFIDLLANLEDRLSIEIELEKLDDSVFTTLGGLAQQVSLLSDR